MSGGNHIRAVGPQAARNAQGQAGSEGVEASAETSLDTHESVDDEGELDLAEYDYEDAYEEAYEPASNRFAWVAPAIAIALIAGWTGLYGWAMQDRLLAAASAAPAEWVRWIIDWSVPVLLVCVGWLLTMRHSRAEAKRFAETAALLSTESSELEARLTVVNRELSLAREFLGAQSLELESLGRVASERLTTHAGELQQLIHDNGAQVDRIGSASETALGNMARLRDDLPVIANSARDVSNQVGNAGRTAHEQLDKLVSGFERLNQFGKASEAQVTSLDNRVGEILTGFENQLSQIEQLISARLEAVQAQTGSFRSELESVESQALEALKERMGLLQTETQSVATELRAAEKGAMDKLMQSKSRFQDEVTKVVESLDRLDAQAVTASQERIKALHEQAIGFDTHLSNRNRIFETEVAKRQEEFDTREAQASELLAQRLADLDDAMTQRREAQAVETEKLVAQSSSMGEQLDKLTALIGEISETGETARSGLTEGLEELSGQLAKRREELAETEAKLGELTESGIRLLEIIQSGAKHSREDLPQAIETASATLGTVEERAAALSGLMLGAHEKADGLSNYLIETQSKIESADSSIEALQAKLSEQSEDALSKLDGLRGGFARLTEQSETFAGGTQEKLREALGALEDATTSAFTALDSGAREKVTALAGDISKDAVTEIERALRNDTAETVGKLEQAASHASGVGREATAQLRDQLAKVNELTINLEQRIARAHELAEEQVGNDFARRMALITDSLNSNAIDIASSLSTEVADTSWDAYLKGDRGIFTRRAVRLIDNGDAKEIAELYQRDDTFKANVSRYIHDFEAMLRAMLSTRDGNALSVTLLGSDMGKLYVVLAQSIERFRQ
ncbi:ATPase [uncultured Erythrobacter sp.]|uniref:ATPase n=1 Tax=uncultured Erythrobacter sp. TaxID=263913 RepID=UPI0026399CC8|nr:ATPase [uncultured Erythrobacter sp.]